MIKESIFTNIPTPTKIDIRQLQVSGNTLTLKSIEETTVPQVSEIIQDLMKDEYKRLALQNKESRDGHPIEQTLIITKAGIGLRQKSATQVIEYRYTTATNQLKIGESPASKEDYLKFGQMLEHIAGQKSILIHGEKEI